MRGFRSGGGVFLHVHALGCLFIFVRLRGCRYHRFFFCQLESTRLCVSYYHCSQLLLFVT